MTAPATVADADARLIVERRDDVLLLTLSNPTMRNALHPDIYATGSEALTAAADDPTLGAIVLAGAALGEALALAHSLARGPRRAHGRIKALRDAAGHHPLERQLELETDHFLDSLFGTEAAEGIDAFRAKRAPDFPRSPS